MGTTKQKDKKPLKFGDKSSLTVPVEEYEADGHEQRVPVELERESPIAGRKETKSLAKSSFTWCGGSSVRANPPLKCPIHTPTRITETTPTT